VIVRKSADVDASGDEAVDVLRVHPIMDALFRPEVTTPRHTRLQVDDPSVRGDAFQFLARVAANVFGRDRTRNRTVRFFTERDIIARVTNVGS
jgi:hypothetical protein